MEKTKHTPAPWHRNIKSDDARYPVIFAGRNQHIASAKGHGQLPPEEIEANISLIAAAPELLEALKIAGNRLFYLHSKGGLGKEIHNWLDEEIEIINAVITKAIGEE